MLTLRESTICLVFIDFIKFIALFWLSFWCLVTVSVLWLFVTVSWVGLQSAIVVFPDHTHSLLYNHLNMSKGNE